MYTHISGRGTPQNEKLSKNIYRLLIFSQNYLLKSSTLGSGYSGMHIISSTLYYTNTYIYIYICVHICIYIFIYIYIYIYTCVYTYIYIYITYIPSTII